MVGLMNTLLDKALYFVISRHVWLLTTHGVWAKRISYTMGVIHSALWCKLWVFRSKGSVLLTFVLFSLTILTSIAVNTAVMYV